MDAPFPPLPPSPQDGETQERIEAEIAETREDLSRTIDEIEHRLNPRRLANQAAESIKDATIGRVEAMMDSASETAADLAGRTRDTAASVAGHVRENPLPAALLGLGLGWLLYSREFSTRETSAPWSDEDPWSAPEMRSRSLWSAIGEHPVPALITGAGLGWLIRNALTEPSRRGAGFYPAREATPTKERLTSLAGSAQESVKDIAGSVRDAAGRAGTEVRRYSGDLQNEFGRRLQQNPLALGVAALAIGAAVGMSVPDTEIENKAMGDTRDSLVDRAHEATRQVVEQVKETVRSVK